MDNHHPLPFPESNGRIMPRRWCSLKETKAITEKKHRHGMGETWLRENLGSMRIRSLEGHPGETALVREPWEKDRDME